jgi:aldehyde:ferredoxin oxidoreductase
MIMWLSRCHKSGIITEEETGLPLSKVGSSEFIESLLEKIANRQGFGDILARGTMEAAKVVGKDSKKLITDYMIETGENSVYGARLYITTGMFYAMELRMPIQHLHEISIPAMIWGFNKMGWQDDYMNSAVIRKIAKKFWGSEVAADFSTYEGKAMAAASIQDREYAKESMILCDLSWPINHSPFTGDHMGDASL